MQPERTPESSVTPFLAKSAIARTTESSIPGYYCDEMDMWVVETEIGKVPIISKGAIPQLITKTKVNEEEDDESPFSLQLVTKTEQQIERDDDHPPFFNEVLQLITKTDTVQESDDNFEALREQSVTSKKAEGKGGRRLYRFEMS
ncbi:hypothetical protein QC758_10475 [Halomonas campisalis]|nr:hypothetical protein [Halomonas campisalis]MDR5863385.1 hypothetical protein [Halomonas campisalis]